MTKTYRTTGLDENTTGSLYDCLAALRDAKTENAYVREGKTAHTSKRAVAFWCAWREQVAPMFSTSESERAEIATLTNNNGNGKTL